MREWGLETMFYLTALVSIAIPAVIFVGLLILPILDKEYDYLVLENKKIRLEKKLKDMEYIQLNQQIRPHFLFNAMNAMLSQVRLGRIEDSIRAMESFSSFFRYHYKTKSSLVLFQEEFAHTKNYIQIQKTRFGKRLIITYDLDPLAIETKLPPYTLQTFVENAFKHGLEKTTGDRELIITLRREGDWVRLMVLDNGKGFLEESPIQFGTGLHNIQRRFELLFSVSTQLNLRRVNHYTVIEAYWPYTPEGIQ